jgi:hypothetical protein
MKRPAPAVAQGALAKAPFAGSPTAASASVNGASHAAQSPTIPAIRNLLVIMNQGSVENKLHDAARLADALGRTMQIDHLNHFLRVLKRRVVQRAQAEGVAPKQPQPGTVGPHSGDAVKPAAGAVTKSAPSAVIATTVQQATPGTAPPAKPQAAVGPPVAKKASVTKAVIAKTPPQAPQIPAVETAPLSKVPPKQAIVAKVVSKIPPKTTAIPPKQTLAKVPQPSPAATDPAATQPEASDGGDPLHTLIGDIQSNPVVDADGNLNDDRLGEIVTKLWDGCARKPKDWTVAWVAMRVPLDRQVEALQKLLNVGFARTDDPEKAPMVISELVKMHKIKLRSVEEALLAFGQNFDGILAINEEAWQFYAKFLVQVFPKPSASGWGWSRVGWSFQSWWLFVEKCLQTLDSTKAFEVISLLLLLVQDREGTTIAELPGWTEGDRLTRVLTKLCELGSCDAGEVIEQLTNQGVVVPIALSDSDAMPF